MGGVLSKRVKRGSATEREFVSLANNKPAFILSTAMRAPSENCSYDVGAMAGRPSTRKHTAFGQKLANLRAKRGLTQLQLAEALGVTQAAVAYYERRATNPSLDLINRLAVFFDVLPSDLVDDAAVPKPTRPKAGRPSALDEAFDAARTLPRTKQQKLAKIVHAYVASESTT